MENNRNQDGTGASAGKRINEYRGGAAPKPKKMEVPEAIAAASGTLAKYSKKIKETKEAFDESIAQAAETMEKFDAAVSKVPTYIGAHLDESSREKIDKLEESINKADFKNALRKGIDEVTTGWIADHKLKVWIVIIVFVLLGICGILEGIHCSIEQGKAEERTAQYQRYAEVNEQDARNWRQFKEKNPRTAAKFLQTQKEQP